MTALNAYVACRTHVGLVRQRNEDAFFHGRCLFVVADGLGGHVAGAIASATAVKAVEPYDIQTGPERTADVLGRAISDANEAIRQHVRREPDLAGMGTTMVAILHAGSSAVLANIGDSRAYLVRDFRADATALVQVSEDHTYQKLVSSSDLVPHLPEKITRFLDGRADGRSPDLTRLELRDGDRILLCSDGLSSYVPRERIHSILTTPDGREQAAESLIKAALSYGAPDNVTVLVIDFEN